MLVLIILIQLNLASYALGTNAWYSPEGEQTPNDVVHNVVWLNRSPQTLIFQTEISEWTLSVHQFGAPNSAQITWQTSDGPTFGPDFSPNFTLPWIVTLDPFNLSAPLMFFFQVASNNTDPTNSYTLNSHYFNITTDPSKVWSGMQPSDAAETTTTTSSTPTPTTSSTLTPSSPSSETSIPPKTEIPSPPSTNRSPTMIGLWIGLGISVLLIASLTIMLYAMSQRHRPKEQAMTQRARQRPHPPYARSVTPPMPKELDARTGPTELDQSPQRGR